MTVWKWWSKVLADESGGYLSGLGGRTVARQSCELTGGKRPCDFSGEECWQGVCFDRAAVWPPQGAGWGIIDMDVDSICRMYDVEL